MYKLLLATNDQAVRDAFAAIAWENMGFKQPRLAASAQEALESLRAYHADAIAVALPAEEDAALIEALLSAYPDLPVVAAPARRGEAEGYVLELRRLLLRLNADISNDDYTIADQMMVCRHEFFRALMDRRIPTGKDVERLLRLVRSKMDPHRPCVVAELTMPVGSDFLKGRWHYGPERLEMALRNIFGVEVAGLRILSCVLPGERIVLLGCPMLHHQLETAENSMTGVVSSHVQDCIDHVDEYLGIDLSISAMHVLPALTAMARDKAI
ncbi:MAG: hypothetical protein IJB81_10860 [Clostridia bacterium]|nr:hypothetical protein [Clostridia bacterium]